MADFVVRCENCHYVSAIDFEKLKSSLHQLKSRDFYEALLSRHNDAFTNIYSNRPRIGDCDLLVTRVPLASTCLYCGNHNLHPSTLERLQELTAEFLAADHTMCLPGHQHTVLFSQK